MYHPFNPGVPLIRLFTVGATVSTFALKDEVVLVSPRVECAQ
jgi:hypothetical protein